MTATPQDRQADRQTSPFDALGDPVRRRLMVVLSGGEHSVGSLVEALQRTSPISQPAVSQHLAVLRAVGLVRVRAEGTRRLHSLDPDGVAAARRWLGELLDPLEGAAGPLEALATEVARGKRRRAATTPARATAQDVGSSGEQPDQRSDRGPRRSSA